MKKKTFRNGIAVEVRRTEEDLEVLVSVPEAIRKSSLAQLDMLLQVAGLVPNPAIRQFLVSLYEIYGLAREVSEEKTP